MRKLILPLVLCAVLCAQAIEIIKPSAGDIPVYSAADYLWRGDVIFNDAPHPVETYRACGQDFFTHEYGTALDFARGDVLKATEATMVGKGTVRNGALEIESSADGKSFGLYWGRTARSPKGPGVCLGEYNGNVLSQWEFAELNLEQSAPTSVWRFVVYDDSGRPMGKGAKWMLEGMGCKRFLRSVWNNCGAMNGRRRGIGLECLTPESGVKLRSFNIRPRGGDVYFRKEFALGFKPDVAKLSFMVHSLDDYDLFVNGVNLARPTGQKESIQPCNLDIAKYLKAGTNTLAIRTRYTVLYSYPCGPEPRSRLVLDLFAYDRTGRSRFIGSGTDWKTTFENPAAEWINAGFDDSKWRTPTKGSIWTKTTAGVRVPIGFNPQHMGFLTTKPVGTKYPLFAAETQEPRRFVASYPAGLKDAALAVRFVRADTGAAAEAVEVKRGEKDGFVRVGYELRGSEPGPYFLNWTLTANGLDETREDEVLFVGKVRQDAFKPCDVDRALRERLELVQTIDPAKEHALGDRFMTANCDKGGHLETVVVETNGYSYLTYPQRGHNYVMTWRLDTPEIGEPYYVEIDVPDDKERTMHVGVAHSVGANYDGCHMPSGGKALTDCAGAITTGGVQPLTGGLKTLTLVFYAANRISSVVFAETWQNRNPTAVAAIRLYRVRGGLPAMALPKTDRRIMEHHERFSTWQTYAACSHSVEQGSFHPFIYHRHAWKIWYEAIARKIRMLRFKGHNASVEGIYMYDHTVGPDDDFVNSPHDGELFDVPYLLSWMYDTNGIDCYFGWEQNRTGSSQMSGVERGVSDRKIQRGLDRGIYTVRTNGTQNICYAASGVNMFAKGVREDSFASIKRVYDRYERYGHVKGFFLAYGFWWVPCFPQMCDDDSTLHGFDDDSMDAFTCDTGIRFDVRPDDPGRFQKRWQIIHAKHKDRYYSWRKAKYEEWFRDLNKLLSSGENAWPILLSPNFSHDCGDRRLPFVKGDATQDEKDGHLQRRFDREGWSTSFAKLQGVKNYFAPVGFNADWKWGVPKFQRAWSDYIRNDGTQKVIGEMGSFYASFQLAELHLWFNFEDRPWYWRGIGALCSQQRPAGKAAYLHELEACKEQTPKAMVVAGIDCNPYNGQTEECRRFAAGFYAMPEGPMRRIDTVKGVDARVAKGGYLRLYNISGEALQGELVCSSSYESEQVAGLRGKRNVLSVPPYALLVFHATDDKATWKAAFNRK